MRRPFGPWLSIASGLAPLTVSCCICYIIFYIYCIGGDQGLLNSFFDWWPTSGPAHRIPFTYNVTFTASYGYLPALQRFRDQVRAVHFIGKEKPWMCHRHGNHANGEFVAMWWAIHDRHVKGMLTFADRPAFSGYYNVPSFVC